jgi:hypothetical protein
VVGSSKLPVSRLSSSSSPSPGGAVPFRVNGLYLSNSVMRVGGTRVRLAALGRGRLGPLEVVEAGRVLDVAELGVGVGGEGRSRHEQNRQTASKAS